MRLKVLLIIVSVYVIVVSIINRRNNIEFKEHNNNFKIQENYLKENLKYALLLEKKEIADLPEKKEIIIYYSGGSCSVCVEDLLLYFKKNDKFKDKVSVIVDSKSKSDLVIGFNDGFQTNFEYKIDSLNYFTEIINEVIVFKLEQKKIKSLLIYRPEEQNLFLKNFY